MAGYTQADLDALCKNIAKGVKKLRLGNGEEVEFNSYADMRRLLADMEAELSGQSKTGFAVGYANTGRGL